MKKKTVDVAQRNILFLYLTFHEIRGQFYLAYFVVGCFPTID
jgi:hypothetical protein